MIIFAIAGFFGLLAAGAFLYCRHQHPKRNKRVASTAQVPHEKHQWGEDEDDYRDIHSEHLPYYHVDDHDYQISKDHTLQVRPKRPARPAPPP